VLVNDLKVLHVKHLLLDPINVVVKTSVDTTSAAANTPRNDTDKVHSINGIDQIGSHAQWAARVTLAWARVATIVSVADLRGDVDAVGTILGNAASIRENFVGVGVHETRQNGASTEGTTPTRNGRVLIGIIETSLWHADGFNVCVKVNTGRQLEDSDVVHDERGVVAQMVANTLEVESDHPGLLVNTVNAAELSVVQAWIWVAEAMSSRNCILVSDQRSTAKESVGSNSVQRHLPAKLARLSRNAVYNSVIIVSRIAVSCRICKTTINTIPC